MLSDLSLITSKPLASISRAEVDRYNDEYDVKAKGLRNEDGAWCWREDCRGDGFLFNVSRQQLMISRLLEINQGNAEDIRNSAECRGSLRRPCKCPHVTCTLFFSTLLGKANPASNP